MHIPTNYSKEIVISNYLKSNICCCYSLCSVIALHGASIASKYVSVHAIWIPIPQSSFPGEPTLETQWSNLDVSHGAPFALWAPVKMASFYMQRAAHAIITNQYFIFFSAPYAKECQIFLQDWELFSRGSGPISSEDQSCNSRCLPKFGELWKRLNRSLIHSLILRINYTQPHYKTWALVRNCCIIKLLKK